jgi:hypothetical protein
MTRKTMLTRTACKSLTEANCQTAHELCTDALEELAEGHYKQRLIWLILSPSHEPLFFS